MSLDDPSKSIAVVYGENGRGKTGLFRAIIFCLYGERRLSQDGNVPDKEIQLVNVSAVQGSGGQPVETSIELTFLHRKRVYQLCRTIAGMRVGDAVIEEITDLQLSIREPDGNTRFIDRREIDEEIAKVLDPRVKEYFLFDGEKIEHLTRAGKEQRREISRGMRNLLRVDALELAIKASKRVAKSFESELERETGASQVGLSRLLKQLGDSDSEYERISKRLEQLTDEHDLACREFEEVEKKLDEFKEIQHLLNSRKQAEQQLRAFKQRADYAMGQMRTHVCKTAALIAARSVDAVFARIDEQKQKGEIPSEIRRDLIERIMSEQRCICGTAVHKGTPEYENIDRWLKKTSESALEDAALDLWRFLAEAKSHFEDDADLARQRIIEHSNIIHQIERLQDEVTSINSQIGESEREDATKLEQIRKDLQRKITTIEADILTSKAHLQELESIRSRLQQQLKEEKHRASRSSQLTKRSILAREVHDALNEVHHTYTSEVRNVIGKSATQIFKRLLDEDGKATLRTIIVNEDYSLEVLDQYEQPFLANVSAGQRQIMSIAFITALAMAASDADRIEIPLFMDSPFGRLSVQHRRNIIREVPQLTSQWIILATDTEFRREEALAIRATGKWGKFFMLRATGDGNTVIQECRVDEGYSMLPREEEPTL